MDYGRAITQLCERLAVLESKESLPLHNPTGMICSNGVAYLDRINQIAQTTGQKIKSLDLKYEELGEYAEDIPRPTIHVEFKS